MSRTSDGRGPVRPSQAVARAMARYPEAMSTLACTAPRLRGDRGRQTPVEQRRAAVQALDAAIAAGAPVTACCAVVGISRSTYRRWQARLQEDEGGDRRALAHPVPPHAGLGAQCREARRDVLCQPCFAALSPGDIVAVLADAGIYLGSVSTFYRERRRLREEQKAAARAQAQGGPCPATVCATASNQIWAMDFTLLPLRGGRWCRLCALLDIYDRCVLAWQVRACQADSAADLEAAASQAAEVLRTAIMQELGDAAATRPLLLRTDCGAEWRQRVFCEVMEGTAICHTLSRHLHPNDNPHIERIWHTFKSHPDFPRHGFASVEAARQWVEYVLEQYHELHHHAALMGLTPHQYRSGQLAEVLSRRQVLLRCARAAAPQAFHGTEESGCQACSPRPAQLRVCEETEQSRQRRQRQRQARVSAEGRARRAGGSEQARRRQP